MTSIGISDSITNVMLTLMFMTIIMFAMVALALTMPMLMLLSLALALVSLILALAMITMLATVVSTVMQMSDAIKTLFSFKLWLFQHSYNHAWCQLTLAHLAILLIVTILILVAIANVIVAIISISLNMIVARISVSICVIMINMYSSSHMRHHLHQQVFYLIAAHGEHLQKQTKRRLSFHSQDVTK